MKIVQLLPELNEGGVERGTVELNRELVKRGVESIVISAGGKLVAQLEADGGQHVMFDACSKNILTAPSRIYRLRKLLRQLNPDVLHARSRVPAWLTYFANKKLHVPLVTTVHGFNSVNRYSKIMTCGDHIICVSGAIKDYIQTHYQVPNEKITVIPRGVDLALFDPETVNFNFIQQFKQEYALEGKFVVSSVGRITQLKDFETFIRGVVTAKEKIPNICGLIVGGVRQDKQGYYNQLKTLIRELHAEEYIRFTGSQSKIAEIYSLSDLVVICSKKPESFGRTAAEAIAMGTPVIATAHGGILDIVKEAQTGFLFQVGDVEELVEKIVKAKETSCNLLRQHIIDDFSLSQMVEKTLSVYKELSR